MTTPDKRRVDWAALIALGIMLVVGLWLILGGATWTAVR